MDYCHGKNRLNLGVNPTENGRTAAIFGWFQLPYIYCIFFNRHLPPRACIRARRQGCQRSTLDGKTAIPLTFLPWLTTSKFMAPLGEFHKIIHGLHIHIVQLSVQLQCAVHWLPLVTSIFVYDNNIITKTFICTMQDGRVVGKKRLILNTDEIIIITSFPNASSYEWHMVSTPPVVPSLYWWIRPIGISADKPKLYVKMLDVFTTTFTTATSVS